MEETENNESPLRSGDSRPQEIVEDSEDKIVEESLTSPIEIDSESLNKKIEDSNEFSIQNELNKEIETIKSIENIEVIEETKILTNSIDFNNQNNYIKDNELNVQLEINNNNYEDNNYENNKEEKNHNEIIENISENKEIIFETSESFIIQDLNDKKKYQNLIVESKTDTFKILNEDSDNLTKEINVSNNDLQINFINIDNKPNDYISSEENNRTIEKHENFTHSNIQLQNIQEISNSQSNLDSLSDNDINCTENNNQYKEKTENNSPIEKSESLNEQKIPSISKTNNGTKTQNKKKGLFWGWKVALFNTKTTKKENIEDNLIEKISPSTPNQTEEYINENISNTGHISDDQSDSKDVEDLINQKNENFEINNNNENQIENDKDSIKSNDVANNEETNEIVNEINNLNTQVNNEINNESNSIDKQISNIEQAIPTTVVRNDSNKKKSLTPLKNESKKDLNKDNEDTDIIHSGYLTKEGAVFRSWKKRFFILRNNKVLYYHANPKSVSKGQILLHNTQIKKIENRSYKGKDNCFQIYSQEFSRTYYMFAESPEDMDIWIKKLRLVTYGYNESHMKWLVLGPSGSGKSSLIQRWINGVFDKDVPETKSVEMTKCKATTDDGQVIEIVLFEANEKNINIQSIDPSTIDNTCCVILVFDVTNKESWETVKSWLPTLKSQIKESLFIIVGTKMDLNSSRAVSSISGFMFASKTDVDYMEATATSNLGDYCFSFIVDQLVRKGKVSELLERTNHKESIIQKSNLNEN